MLTATDRVWGMDAVRTRRPFERVVFWYGVVVFMGVERASPAGLADLSKMRIVARTFYAELVGSVNVGEAEDADWPAAGAGQAEAQPRLLFARSS